MLTLEQTRVYEKLRFPRVRIAQTNGEDLRNRWHSALKGLDDGIVPDPEGVMIRASSLFLLPWSVLIWKQNRHLYEYDAEAETHLQWDALSTKVREELRTGKITPLC